MLTHGLIFCVMLASVWGAWNIPCSRLQTIGAPITELEGDWMVLDMYQERDDMKRVVARLCTRMQLSNANSTSLDVSAMTRDMQPTASPSMKVGNKTFHIDDKENDGTWRIQVHGDNNVKHGRLLAVESSKYILLAYCNRRPYRNELTVTEVVTWSRRGEVFDSEIAQTLQDKVKTALNVREVKKMNFSLEC